MFNLEDYQIKKVINNRGDGMYLMPLYVNIDGTKYAIDELNKINQLCESSLKIGYGSIISYKDIFSIDYNFISNHFFNIHFWRPDDIIDINDTLPSDTYVYFETAYRDINNMEIYSFNNERQKKFVEQMNEITEMIYERVKTIYDKYRQSLVTE